MAKKPLGKVAKRRFFDATAMQNFKKGQSVPEDVAKRHSDGVEDPPEPTTEPEETKKGAGK